MLPLKNGNFSSKIFIQKKIYFWNKKINNFFGLSPSINLYRPSIELTVEVESLRVENIHSYPSSAKDCNTPMVGNDFFPGGVQGVEFGLRAQEVDFGTQILTNFDQISNFSLF